MTTRTTRHLRRVCGASITAVLVAALTTAVGWTQERPSLTTEADFLRAMKELSNWGRWGPDDELGAANFITPAKRKAAAALVTEGISVSLAHDVIQEDAVDGGTYLDRQVLRVSATGASDRYQYTGTYHGAIHSHLDSVACHVMFEGKGYNGVADGSDRGDGRLSAGQYPRAAGRHRDTRHPVRRDPAPRQGDGGRLARTGHPGHLDRPRDAGRDRRCACVGRRRHPVVYGPLETPGRARSLADVGRGRRLSG